MGGGALKENYETLLKKQMDAKMAEHLERRWKGERFRVLDPAHLPEEPFYPNRPLLALLGLPGGLALGLIAACGAEYLDHLIKGSEELQALIPYPILAGLPLIRDKAAAPRSHEEQPRVERPRRPTDVAATGQDRRPGQGESLRKRRALQTRHSTPVSALGKSLPRK